MTWLLPERRKQRDEMVGGPTVGGGAGDGGQKAVGKEPASLQHSFHCLGCGTSSPSNQFISGMLEPLLPGASPNLVASTYNSVVFGL